MLVLAAIFCGAQLDRCGREESLQTQAPQDVLPLVYMSVSHLVFRADWSSRLGDSE